MVARPPTSAVLGRNVSPARRTAGLLLILADETRLLRPTVFTAASRLERATLSEFLFVDTARVIIFVRATDAFVVVASVLAPLKIRETVLRTTFGAAEEPSVEFVGVRVAVRATVDRDAEFVVAAVVSDVGKAREIAPSAAIAAGATTISAKKQVSSFFISFSVNYIIKKQISH